MKRPVKDWAFFFGALAAFIVVVSVCAWMFGHLADRRATIYKEGYDAGLEEGLGRSDYSQYNKGFSDGEKSAYHAFSKEDYAEGYEAGYETGSEKGYTDGYSDGHFDGYREGYDKGYLNGYEIGEENGRDDALAGLYEDGLGGLIEDTERIRSEVLRDQDVRIAQMHIPNPVNPGFEFQSMAELEDYARQLHAAGN